MKKADTYFTITWTVEGWYYDYNYD